MTDQPARRLLRTLFHADLSDAHAGEDYFVSVRGQRIRLLPHSEHSLREALAAAPHLGGGAARPTHYAEEAVELPGDAVVRVHLRHSLRTFRHAKPESGVGHCGLYIPPPRAARLAADAVVHAAAIDYVSTARTFLFHHQDLITDDPELARIIVEEYMIGDRAIATEINNLATLMRNMGPPTETGGWARLVPFTPELNPETGFDGQTVYYKQEPTAQVQTAALAPMAPLLVCVQNDARLRDKKWSVQTGSSVEPAAAPPAAKAQGKGKGKATTAKTSTTKTSTTKTMATSAAAPAAGEWQAAVANRAPISGVKTALSVTDPAKRQVELKLENSYIRYLMAYVRFYDADGKAIRAPDWTPDDTGFVYAALAACDVQYDDVRLLGYISPINALLGVPIGPNGKLAVKITFPKNAVSASVYGSGLGTGSNPWPKTPALGGAVTGTFNLGVPALMLGFGAAAATYQPLYDIIDTLMKNKIFVVTALTLAGIGGGVYGTYAIGSTFVQHEVNWPAFTTIINLLFSPVSTQALLWVQRQITTQVLAEQIPFVGWIMLAVNVTTGLAQMAQTIVAVTTSRWNIENRIATTVTTAVSVHKDPRATSFPLGVAGARRSLSVKMIYQDEARPTVTQTIDVPPGSTDTVLTVLFPGNTLGGRVKFEADFYQDDWLAGKATTGFVPNDAEHAARAEMYLVQYPVPLTDQSIYRHARILTWSGDTYAWRDSDRAPTATLTARDTSPSGNAIGDWTGLTLSQRAGILGLSWQAAGMGIADCDTGASGQLYAFQDVNSPGTPMNAVRFPRCGFAGKTRLIYDPYPPKFKMQDGNWVVDGDGRPVPDPADLALGEYYVDPRRSHLPYDQGGGYHLRKVRFGAGVDFDMSATQPSRGRFAYFPDSVCMHPSGLVIGVSAQYQKLQIVRLAAEDLKDVDVPLGAVGSGPALDQNRPGLMFHPVAVTCAYDGTIMVLEDTKSSTGTAITAISRLSAYDLQMNPVNRFFDDRGEPSPWLYLSHAADYHYLDVSAVGDDKMTYIYVLYYTGTGATPADYHMAIYTYGASKPDKNPLVTTDAIAAAKLTADMWHSVYTLNFAMVTDANGHPAGPTAADTGPAGRTVPSVSMWVPPLPAS